MTNREYEEYIAPVQPVNPLTNVTVVEADVSRRKIPNWHNQAIDYLKQAIDYLKVPEGCPEPEIVKHRLHVAKVLVANHKLTWTDLSIEQRHEMLDIAHKAIDDAAILLKGK